MGTFCSIAGERNWEIAGIECSTYAAQIAREKTGMVVHTGTINDARITAGEFTVITAFDVLEHIGDPGLFIETIADLLPTGGICAISTPDTSSISCRMMGRNWFQYKPEHCSYFSKVSLSRLLFKKGFQVIKLTAAHKRITPSYLCHYGEKFAPEKLRPYITLLLSLLPQTVLNSPFPVPTGELFLLARKVR
jgi:2-polyprenyl-3-methyl-5-hydroxy-6-metoxy-1,4-benzoquinol methylase